MKVQLPSSLAHPRVMKTMDIVSKLMPFLPLLFLFIGIGLYANRQKEAMNNPRRASVVQVQPTQAASDSAAIVAQKLKKINLNGPMTCEYEGTNATVSAGILENRIAVKTKEATVSSSFVVVEDCLYIWQEGVPVGQTQCGVSQPLGILRLIASFGMLDLGSIISALPEEMKAQIASNEAEISAFVDSCVEKTPDVNLFNLPKNVEFSTKTE